MQTNERNWTETTENKILLPVLIFISKHVISSR